jgi:hypothetical protein
MTFSVQFFPKLYQNFINILESGEYCDVVVLVGTHPIIQTFYAHKIILCYRSPTIQTALASNNNINQFTIKDISPDIFQIVLK